MFSPPNLSPRDLTSRPLRHDLPLASHITTTSGTMATVNMERVRKRSASPQDLQRRKRQKTEISASRPSAADLALDHLLHDSDESPLRQHDFNLLLASVCSQTSLDSLIRDPLAELMRRVDSKESSNKLAALRNELLEAWTRRIMQTAGDSLSEVMNISEARGPMTFELGDANMELRFVPVLEIEDTDVAISAADERENTAGIEELSIQGRQEDSEESSETSTVSTETRRKQRERNTGGSMAHFADKPSRLQAKDFHLLERGYTMRELYGSLSVTSSQEREREPPRRVEKSSKKDRMAVIEEHESDEDEDEDEEDEDEEDEQAGPRPQAVEAVRTSTVGNEPQTPEDSVAGSDGDDQPCPSSRIVRFPAVDYPEMHLLCVETRSMQKASLRGKQAGGGFIGAGELATAIASANPGLPRPKVKLYCKRINLVSCETAEQARRMAARGFKFRGQTVKLSPFQPIRSQIFVSAMVCDKVDISSAVHELMSTFPTTRLYVGTCPATNFVNGRKFLIVFEKQSDIRQFHLTLQTKNGAASSMQFDARIRAADEDTERRVRQKTASTAPLPPAADLALSHLLHDRDDHPLRSLDLDQLLNSVLSQDELDSLLRDPLARLMAQVDVKKVDNVDKLVAVRDQLLTRWTERVLQTVGDSLSNVVDLSVARAPMTLELDGARMEIKLLPVFRLAETEEATSGSDEQHQLEGVEDEQDCVREGEDEGVEVEEEEEEHTDTSLHNGAGEQSLDDMHNSNIGEEPVSPEASGEESDGRYGAEANHPQSHERQGVHVHHFLTVDSPEKCLLLTEPAFFRTGQAVMLRELAESAMASAMAPASIVRHDTRNWLFTFATAEAATFALRAALILRGRPLQLSPYKRPSTQTFVGKPIPPSLDLTAVVAQIHQAFPTHRIYVGQCPSSNQGSSPNLVVIFEDTGDIESFEVKLNLHNRLPFSMKFTFRSENLNCYSCQRKHPLAECAELSAVQVPLMRRLLRVPPPIQLV
ncbi:hypothetical protein LTS10_005930 [Elasticomyces elasticus]|nr:hypothetical protein LTS10_005930 [Elasticomyces elasticus]